MQYLIDTNICIRYLKGDSRNLASIISESDPGSIIICSVVRSELFYGVYKSDRVSQNLETLNRFLAIFSEKPFDSSAAAEFGRIRADLNKKGTPIGPYDLQIAAIALVNNYTLITHNIKEFSRVDGLKIEDWIA